MATETTRVSPRKGVVLSEETKNKMVEGRKRTRVIDAYLADLQNNRPSVGRPFDPERAQKRLADIEGFLADSSTSGIQRLKMTQEQINLKQRLKRAETVQPSNGTGSEDEFVNVAAFFSEANSISYTAWRQVGVPAAVLKRAGIKREYKAREQKAKASAQ